MSDLAAFRALMRNILGDPGTRYSNDSLDLALGLALSEYSWAYPQQGSYSLTLTTADEDQVITPTGYLYPVTVFFPDDSTQLSSFYIYQFEDERHFVFTDSEPEVDDVLTMVYAMLQTIEDLNSATVTSVQADHEQHLAMGAAAFAALNRAAGLAENYSTRAESKNLLQEWGVQLQRDFRKWLKTGLSFSVPTIPPASGWKMDEWDQVTQW